MAGLFEKTDSLVSKGVMGAARWGGFAEVCGGKLAPPSLYGADFDSFPLRPCPFFHFPPAFPLLPTFSLGQACESLRYAVLDHRAELLLQPCCLRCVKCG